MHSPELYYQFEKIINVIRAYFNASHFHEVHPYLLHPALPLEPNLYAFETISHLHDRQQLLYLSCSPELELKKYLSIGIDKCFAISNSFRDMENISTLHRPEFLMLEWYRADAEYKNIMQDVHRLIIFLNHQLYPNRTSLLYQGNDIKIDSDWPHLSMDNLFNQKFGLNIQELSSDQKLIELAGNLGYSTENTTWEILFDQIYLNHIEPGLPKDPFFLIDFPARSSSMAKPKSDNPFLAERFELIIAGIEIGNGNTENTDVQKIRESFDREIKFRQDKGITTPPVDQSFLKALSKINEKTYAGIGIGVERLAMLLLNIADIKLLRFR